METGKKAGDVLYLKPKKNRKTKKIKSRFSPR
jgi:hypothetical protein